MPPLRRDRRPATSSVREASGPSAIPRERTSAPWHGQGFRRERLAISGHKNGFATAVCGVENLSEHGSYRNEKPLPAGPSLVLGLNNIKSIKLTLDTIDKDAVGYPLVPSQACDITSMIAKPKGKPVTDARG